MTITRAQALAIDPDWPICRQCREPEPCQCVALCDLCLLLDTRGDSQPCHGEFCQRVKRRNRDQFELDLGSP